MNIARNLEAIFLIAVVLTCATTAIAASTTSHGVSAQPVNDGRTAVVTIVGKRMSATEKAQFDR